MKSLTIATDRDETLSLSSLGRSEQTERQTRERYFVLRPVIAIISSFGTTAGKVHFASVNSRATRPRGKSITIIVKRRMMSARTGTRDTISLAASLSLPH